MPRLQREKDAAGFFRGHRRQPLAFLLLMAPISRRFVVGLARYAQRREIEVVRYRAGERVNLRVSVLVDRAILKPDLASKNHWERIEKNAANGGV